MTLPAPNIALFVNDGGARTRRIADPGPHGNQVWYIFAASFLLAAGCAVTPHAEPKQK